MATRKVLVLVSGVLQEIATSDALIVVSPVDSSFTSTSHTLALAQAGAICVCSNAATQSITFPPNSSVPFPIGGSITLLQAGAGKVTAVAGAGVTLISKASKLSTNGQGVAITAIKTGTDTWYVAGDLTT